MSPLGSLSLCVLCMLGHVSGLTEVKKNSTFMSCQASEQSERESLVAPDQKLLTLQGHLTEIP